MGPHVPLVLPRIWVLALQQLLPGQQLSVSTSQLALPQSFLPPPLTQLWPVGQQTLPQKARPSAHTST